MTPPDNPSEKSRTLLLTFLVTKTTEAPKAVRNHVKQVATNA